MKTSFERLKNYFILENKMVILNGDGSRIFNLDQTAFFLCPKEKQALVRKGAKIVYNKIANDGKELFKFWLMCPILGITTPTNRISIQRLPKNLPPSLL